VKDAGYHLIALELTTDSRQLHQPVADVIGPDSKIALVVGNEIQGVGNESLRLCDEAVSIPMFGVKHSLNVAVAFGIGMWEFVRALAPPAGNHHSVRNVARRIDSS
jgi:tRNA G18 (ribose-2'-O)-methylase SpoU